MDEVKWYENCSLDSIKNIIKDNINTASRSFVAIGYYLKNVRDRELYLQDGYQNIWEFAQFEFGISKSSASRFMAINDRFSKDGNSPILLELYKDFSSSKLSEMLTMSEEQLEQVTLTTTVAEIREIKNHGGVVATSQQTEPEISEKDKWLIRCGVLKEMCNALCKMHAFGLEKDRYSMDAIQRVSTGTYSFGFGNDGEGHSKYSAEFEYSQYIVNEFDGEGSWIFESGEVNQTIWNYNGCDWNRSHRESDREPESVNDTAKIVNDVTETAESVIEEPETVVEKGESVDVACTKCTLNNNKDAGILECHPEKGEHKCWIDYNNPGKCESDQVETVEADIIQTVPEEEEDQEVIDPECYTYQDIRDELNKLIEYVGIYRKNNDTAPGRRKAKMRLDAIVLLDEEMRKPPVIEEPEPVQPELPVLKNNDQRKEWIDNYSSWPVWIDIPQTGERYYRYDFSNDTSFVIRVSLQHAYKGYERTKDIKYAHEEYFLLGVKNKWIPGMPTFVESSTNKSSMVEHLKEIQKKGAS